MSGLEGRKAFWGCLSPGSLLIFLVLYWLAAACHSEEAVLLNKSLGGPGNGEDECIYDHVYGPQPVIKFPAM